MKYLRIANSVRRRLLVNRLRVVLSLSGIAVGIACQMAAVALGDGARAAMLAQITSMGSNLITVAAGTFTQAFGRAVQTRSVTTLKPGDAEAIAAGCGHVAGVAPAQQAMATAQYKNGTTATTLIGTTAAFPAVRNYRISSGRFFTVEEDGLASRVAVVGSAVAQALFRGGDPVGALIRINGVPFRVIGTLAAKGLSYDGANQDNEILVPLNTALRRVLNITSISSIYIEATGPGELGEVEREVRNLLRERHRLSGTEKKDDFAIQNVYTTVTAANETNTSFSDLVSTVAALSLGVGGVGILAVMLLSVRERRSEIGLRMALGAKPGDVFFQFLLEATALSVAGGGAGIALGIAAVYLLELLAGFRGIVSIESAGLAVVVSVALGILFGSLPARRASLIEPVKALRA